MRPIIPKFRYLCDDNEEEMTHFGEIISLIVAVSWTATALFASTMIRAIIGGLGFVAIIALQRNIPQFITSLGDRKGVKYAIYATLFGPVLGVSLSLMAVRYTNAGIASTLMALTPVLILLPYSLIYRQKLEIKEVFGASISMVGVAMFFLL